jgi:hypothetical protein
MGKRDHQTTIADDSATIREGDAHQGQAIPAAQPAPKRTRTKVDVTKLHPLDAKLHRMAQAHRLIKLADGLDEESLDLVIVELSRAVTVMRNAKGSVQE